MFYNYFFLPPIWKTFEKFSWDIWGGAMLPLQFLSCKSAWRLAVYFPPPRNHIQPVVNLPTQLSPSLSFSLSLCIWTVCWVGTSRTGTIFACCRTILNSIFLPLAFYCTFYYAVIAGLNVNSSNMDPDPHYGRPGSRTAWRMRIHYSGSAKKVAENSTKIVSNFIYL